MVSSRQQRNRGFLLSDRGRLRLETARQEAEELNNRGKRYTVEQLSQITELDLSTITRVFDSSTRTDRRTLERLFKAFDLKLEANDFYKPQLKANLQQLSPNLPVYYPINKSDIYGREAELKQLTKYLSDSQTITLYGIGGTGKTALAAELFERVKDSFEYICWHSLDTYSSLAEVLSKILEHFSLDTGDVNFETKAAWLVSFMQQHRCLLIFDNVDTIFSHDNNTKSSFEAFFSYISTAVHKSCIILIARQRLNIIASNQSRSWQIDNLSLSAGIMMLRQLGLAASDRVLIELIELYDAHPLSLSLAARRITDIFEGNVEEFLAQKITVFSEIEKLLYEQFEQLSRSGLAVMYWLAVSSKPLALEQLQKDISLTIPDRQMIECLTELHNYLFIQRTEGKFTLQPLIKKYAIEHFKERICREIANEQPEFIITNALTKTTAPDYLRQQQIKSIIKPILNRLRVELGRDRLLTNFSHLLDRQRQQTPRKPGYLAGNVFNLLRYIEAHLDRWDFSNLSVWQADGRGINLRRGNFAFADLTQSRFTEDFGETLSLAISPDREQLAACDTNGQIRLWQIKDKRQQLTLQGHSAWAQQVVYSPDGRTLASCSSDRTIRLWDLSSGSCMGVLRSHQARVRAIAFTPNGQIASAGDDWAIKLWDLNTQTVRQTLKGHTNNIRSIVISPDGQIISSGDDGSIRFWSLDGECLRTIEAHSQAVWTVAISPDGSLIASGSVDNTVKLWDIDSGSLVTTFQHQGAVSQVAFSPDGRTLATASYDRTVRLWNIATKQQLKILPHQDWVQSLVFKEDILITCSRDRLIKYWNIEREEVQTTINSYSNGIWAIAVSPDGKHLVSTNDEQTIQLWNVDRNKIERVLTGHSKSIWSVAYSSDNRFLASASDDCTVRIWSVATEKLYRTIQGNSWFWTVAFCPDNSSTLATAGSDCSIQLWNINTGELIQIFNGHTEIIRQIAFDTKGKYLASCGLDNTAKIWQVNTSERLATFNHPSPVSSVAFHPNKSLLATGSDDNIVRLWDLKTGKILQSFDEHTGWVQSVAFSPDGETLASGSHDGTIKLWRVGQQAIRTLVHGGWVRAITFKTCPTVQQLLVSGSGDGTIKLWNVDTGNCIKTLTPPLPYSQMNITGATGLSESERATLKTLGAVETNVSTMDNVVYLKQFQKIENI